MDARRRGDEENGNKCQRDDECFEVWGMWEICARVTLPCISSTACAKSPDTVVRRLMRPGWIRYRWAVHEACNYDA